MIALARRFQALSFRQRALLAETAAALAFAALAVAMLPFRWSTTRIRQPACPQTALPDCRRQIDEVRWAVTACARRVPWRAKCLEQGLAAIWLLHRRAVPATLHYGLARDGTALAAHAWVRAGDLAVVGCENAGDFTEIARFPAGSRISEATAAQS